VIPPAAASVGEDYAAEAAVIGEDEGGFARPKGTSATIPPTATSAVGAIDDDLAAAEVLTRSHRHHCSANRRLGGLGVHADGRFQVGIDGDQFAKSLVAADADANFPVAVHGADEAGAVLAGFDEGARAAVVEDGAVAEAALVIGVEEDAAVSSRR
jgi:hypothetical protein